MTLAQNSDTAAQLTALTEPEELAQQRVEELLARLKALGVEPDASEQ